MELSHLQFHGSTKNIPFVRQWWDELHGLSLLCLHWPLINQCILSFLLPLASWAPQSIQNKVNSHDLNVVLCILNNRLKGNKTFERGTKSLNPYSILNGHWEINTVLIVKINVVDVKPLKTSFTAFPYIIRGSPYPIFTIL